MVPFHQARDPKTAHHAVCDPWLLDLSSTAMSIPFVVRRALLLSIPTYSTRLDSTRPMYGGCETSIDSSKCLDREIPWEGEASLGTPGKIDLSKWHEARCNTMQR